MGSPDDIFDLAGDDVPLAAVGLDPDSLPLGAGHLPASVLYPVRRELYWFYVKLRGRVPAVGERPADQVQAASRIAGWLSELEPKHRGTFVVRYDGRRWPVRVLRELGLVTSVVVRIAAMDRPRAAGETVADAERAVVTELLADIVAARRPPDGVPCEAATIRLDRLQRAARNKVGRAERAYSRARGGVACVVPVPSREGR